MGRKPHLTPEEADEVRRLWHDRNAKWTAYTLAHSFRVSVGVINAALDRRGAYRRKGVSQ